MGRRWTKEEIDAVKARYANEPSAALAASIGRTAQAVFVVAQTLGLRKSPEYIREKNRMSGAMAFENGVSSRFVKGMVPWNKGKPHPASGRSVETQFKKGNMPKGWNPIGYEYVGKDGYLVRKARDTGNTRSDYDLVHHIVWKSAGNEIPEGCVIVFKDKNRLNIDVSNLEMITRAELVARNSIHNLPPELAEIHRLRGSIVRVANNKKRSNQNEQHRKPA
jgi:hypothetical protein